MIKAWKTSSQSTRVHPHVLAIKLVPNFPSHSSAYHSSRSASDIQNMKSPLKLGTNKIHRLTQKTGEHPWIFHEGIHSFKWKVISIEIKLIHRELRDWRLKTRPWTKLEWVNTKRRFIELGRSAGTLKDSRWEKTVASTKDWIKWMHLKGVLKLHPTNTNDEFHLGEIKTLKRI